MLYRSKPLYNHNRDLAGTFLQILIVIVSGFVLAIIALSQTPLAALLVALILPALLLVLKRPEIAFLVMVFTTSTVISEDKNPILFEIGSGRVFFTELILGVLLGLIVLRWIIEPDFELVRTPLDIPLLGFVGFSFLSIFIALSKVVPLPTTFAAFINTPPEEVSLSIGALRGLVYYLTFFLVTNLIRNKEQVKLLITVFKVLAIVVALFYFAQQAFPSADIVTSSAGVRVETLDTEGVTYQGVVRVVGVPGDALLLTFFIVTLNELLSGRSGREQLIRWISLLIMGGALIITFNRHFYIMVGLSVLLSFLYYGRGLAKRLGQMILVGLTVVVLVGSILIVIPDSKPAQLIDATVSRFSTLLETGTYTPNESTSYGYRVIEIRHALPVIGQNILFGVGPGQRYRSYDPRLDYSGYDGRNYMHNSHVWILVQIGFFGYACLLWFIAVFFVRGLRHLGQVADNQLKDVMVGFYLTVVGILVGSIANPIMWNPYWIPVIAIMIGTNEVLLRLNQVNKKQASAS